MPKPRYDPKMRYFNEFIGMQCAPDLLLGKLFPNVKEISESMGAYNAVRTYLWQWFRPSDPKVMLVVVGDGATPRTAGLFAYRSAWQCHSVDPNLSKNYPNVNRLAIHKNKIEDVSLASDQAIIVAVHSHANLQTAVDSIKSRHIGVVAIPCCVPQIIDHLETEIYEDYGIVKIYRRRN